MTRKKQHSREKKHGIYQVHTYGTSPGWDSGSTCLGTTGIASELLPVKQSLLYAVFLFCFIYDKSLSSSYPGCKSFQRKIPAYLVE